MSSRKIKIFDTTLRDGEQAPGATMRVSDKRQIAEQLDHMGVDIIEAGFPAASTQEFNLIKGLAGIVRKSCLCGLARGRVSDLEILWDAIKNAKKPRIHTFAGTSALHRKHVMKMSKNELLDSIKTSVSWASERCDDVQWSAMDATRTEISFLIDACRTAVDAGARTINIADTVGYSLPQDFAHLIKKIHDAIGLDEYISISVHCHDDLGLAVANSIAALSSGASQIECTINGLGERAGNASLEEVAILLKVHEKALNSYSEINCQMLTPISKLVERSSNCFVQKNKAVVGENAFAHESGIHQEGFLNNRETFEIISPKLVGRKNSEIVMGKHSGRSALKHKLKVMGIDLLAVDLDQLCMNIKSAASEGKKINDEYILIEARSFVNQYDEAKEFMTVTSSLVNNSDAEHNLDLNSSIIEEM